MASPTKTPSPFQQGLGITFPTPTPQQSSGSTHAASLPVSDGLSTVLPVQSQAQPYNDPYQYPWFTKLIILIYGITLSLAGIVLWILPYSGFSTKSIGYITFAFVPWFAYNSGMLLIFALVSLHLSHKRSSGSTSPSKLHGGRPVRYKWTGPIARNAILVAMLGSSCAIGVVIFNNV